MSGTITAECHRCGIITDCVQDNNGRPVCEECFEYATPNRIMNKILWGNEKPKWIPENKSKL